MSLNVTHQLSGKPNEPPLNTDVKRPVRQLAGGRKGKQQRDNIENAPSPTLPAASFPAQKQSSRIRKRLMTENLPSPCTNDHLSTKRHKVLFDDPSIQNVTPLHRTLSDKSSYLNRASSHDVTTDRKDSPSKTPQNPSNWKRELQLKRSGSESDDADDEEEVALSNDSRSFRIPSQPNFSKVAGNHTPKSSPLLDMNNSTFESPSPAMRQVLRTCDDDLFGSDTTLTSPEDDSDDELDSYRPKIEVAPRPSPVSESEVADEVVNPQTISTTVSGPLGRRRPGRPRKNPLPTTSSSPILKASSTPLRKASSDNQLRKTGSLKSLSLSSMKKSSPSLRMSGSLMSRIIDGNRFSNDSNDDLSDSSDDAELIQIAKNSRKTVADQPDADALGSLKDIISKGISALADSVQGCSIGSSQIFDNFQSKKTQSLPKSKDCVFATPVLPPPRSTHSTRSSSSRSNPLKMLSKLHSTSSRHSISKQTHPRSMIRGLPRPQLFQTCLDIMSQPVPSREKPNMHTIKLMLKHSLEQGMRKVKESSGSNDQILAKPPMLIKLLSKSKPGAASLEMEKGSTRKQGEQQRMTERQTIVAEAYRSLNLPPPPENWDKSSKAIIANLSLSSNSTTDGTSDTVAKRLSNVMDDALDHLSRRHGCEYCRKTYRNRNGLMYHMERCTMARLQTSISADFDGESTASETEDQRIARRPMSSEQYPGLNVVRDSSNEEEEDEEGVIMCVCGSKEDEGAMVQCDSCKVWLHIDCLNLTEEDIPDEYFCPTCLGLPIPSTGGKSFRHIPNSSKRKSEDRKVGRPRRRSRSDSLSSDFNKKGGRNYKNELSRHGVSHESESESEESDSMATDDDSDLTGEGLVSPQVVLNHDWNQSSGGPNADLGYPNEYIGLLGIQPAVTIFRQSRAPELMLDGSSSQESQASQAELSNPLLSSDSNFENENESIFHTISDSNMAGLGLELSSETDMSFPDSQSFNYLPSSTTSLFEPEYVTSDSGTPDQLLASEDTIDSDGLRTPVDLQHGFDHIDMWASHNLESFVEESALDFDINCSHALNDYKNDQSSVINVADWFNEESIQPEDFDLNGIIDLEAVSLSDK
ncbi:hypothetical protein BGZ76_009257 [Entomortierella beljakovae]|nr:hypothetical protein BGZ76_009257 [Entomortierella beljakovae]